MQWAGATHPSAVWTARGPQVSGEDPLSCFADLSARVLSELEQRRVQLNNPAEAEVVDWLLGCELTQRMHRRLTVAVWLFASVACVSGLMLRAPVGLDTSTMSDDTDVPRDASTMAAVDFLATIRGHDRDSKRALSVVMTNNSSNPSPDNKTVQGSPGAVGKPFYKATESLDAKLQALVNAIGHRIEKPSVVAMLPKVCNTLLITSNLFLMLTWCNTCLQIGEHWDFDIFQFSIEAEGRPLSLLMYHLFENFRLFDSFKVRRENA